MRLKYLAHAALFGGMIAAAGLASAQETAKKPHVPLQKTIGQVTQTAPEPSLAVMNSDGAKLEGDKLILTGVSPNTIVFADRPIRAAGHQTTEQFISGGRFRVLERHYLLTPEKSGSMTLPPPRFRGRTTPSRS